MGYLGSMSAGTRLFSVGGSSVEMEKMSWVLPTTVDLAVGYQTSTSAPVDSFRLVTPAA